MAPSMHINRPTLAGCALIVVAVIGFLTVADELRHIGEFFGVLAVLLCGVCLLLAGLYPRWSAALALQWAPAGIAVGALVGAATDRVVLGVLLGSGLGLLLARLRRARAA